MPDTDLWADVAPPASRRLLLAALEAFSEHGYFATTTRDISQRAELSPAAVYVHYPSKAEMLAEICRRGHAASIKSAVRPLGGYRPVCTYVGVSGTLPSPPGRSE